MATQAFAAGQLVAGYGASSIMGTAVRGPAATSRTAALPTNRGYQIRAEEEDWKKEDWKRSGEWKDPISTGVSKGIEGVRQVVKNFNSDVATDPKNTEHGAPYPLQQQGWPGEEWKMDPKPDWGYDSYKGSGKLKDKIAIVTGGDSGIGRAVAWAYAKEGAHVVIPYYNEHRDAEDIKKAIEEDAGREVLLLPGDLALEETCINVIDETVKKFGRIDILVNNASYQGKWVDDISQISRERFEKAFDTNIVAMFSLAKHAIPHMKPGSSIINVTSIVAYQPLPGILDYLATKGAIVSFTKGLGEMCMTNHGIRVNGVAPGPIWTPISVQSFTPPFTGTYGAVQTPTLRAAQPKECAGIFVLLASDEASYMNSCIYGVTGGLPIN